MSALQAVDFHQVGQYPRKRNLVDERHLPGYIREVQEYLGHKSVETTMIYTHVMRGLTSSAVSPLDALPPGQSGPAVAAQAAPGRPQRTGCGRGQLDAWMGFRRRRPAAWGLRRDERGLSRRASAGPLPVVLTWGGHDI